KDQRLVIDVYGTLHSEDLWDKPNEFIPERFIDWDGSPFDMLPQGGGDYWTNHRCAGEWITVIIMEETMKYFANEITWDVPEQDLSIKLNSIPGYINSGMVINNVGKKYTDHNKIFSFRRNVRRVFLFFLLKCGWNNFIRNDFIVG